MYKKRVIFNYKWLLIISMIVAVIYTSYVINVMLPFWSIITGPEEYNVEKNFSLRSHAIVSVLQWSRINSECYLLPLLFPVCITLGLLSFKEDLQTYFIFGKNRFNSYGKELLKTMLLYSIMMSLVFTFGHCLIYGIFYILTPVTTDISLESTSYLFNFMVPSDLFEGYPIYYFLTTVILNDIPIIFAYTLFFCMSTVYLKDNLLLFAVFPTVFSFILLYVSNSVHFEYGDLTVPFLGYYSNIFEIWKYTMIPLFGFLIGLTIHLMRVGDSYDYK